MKHTRIIVVSDVQYHDAYRSLAFHEERFEFRPFPSDPLILNSDGIAILIIDCGYDVKKGLDFAKHFKPHCPAVPIVFITEISSEETAIEAFRLGIREYLKKPVDAVRLKEIIDLLLEIRHMTKERRTAFPLYCRHKHEVHSVLEDAELPENIHDVLGYIKANLSEDMCLKKLAEHASISKFHFCKTFKKHVGLPPLRYVNVMRIDEAKRLLFKNGLNISDVATQVGFNDLSSFCKHFKRLTGMSPTTFKSAIRESAGNNHIHANSA
jgi:YesN/AraC family two-component response regulator